MDKVHALVVAHDEALGIGKNNKLPWHIKGDMKFFRDLTCQTKNTQTKNAVIMGRKTWESLPTNYRPLPNRINLVLTKDADYLVPQDVIVSQSLEEALSQLSTKLCEKVFVIGGGAVYEEAIKMNLFSLLYVTEIKGTFDCDTFFPEYRNDFTLINNSAPMVENHYCYQHNTYKRKE